MSDDETTRIMTRRRKENIGANKETMSTNSIETQTNRSNYSDVTDRDDEDNTKLFSPRKKDSSHQPDVNDSENSIKEDPVVGWLVILDGPGKGNCINLGFGVNGIGRNETNRARLDFGDEEISRDSHALLTYDPKNTKFFIQHGNGKNLTYVGEDPVLQPRELIDKNIISLGNTKLMFVALCSEHFQW